MTEVTGGRRLSGLHIAILGGAIIVGGAIVAAAVMSHDAHAPRSTTNQTVQATTTTSTTTTLAQKPRPQTTTTMAPRPVVTSTIRPPVPATTRPQPAPVTTSPPQLTAALWISCDSPVGGIIQFSYSNGTTTQAFVNSGGYSGQYPPTYETIGLPGGTQYGYYLVTQDNLGNSIPGGGLAFYVYNYRACTLSP